MLTAELSRKVRTNKCFDWVGLFTKDTCSFVRNTAATNPHLSKLQIERLLYDAKSGVISTTLRHPKLTRKQFRSVVIHWKTQGYCWIMHTSLAEHRFATMNDLDWLLTHHSTESVQLNVLNNHKGREPEAFKTIIKPLLAPKEKRNHENFKQWTIVQKIAYLRFFGHQYPS
jgi:hypothetical protein